MFTCARPLRTFFSGAFAALAKAEAEMFQAEIDYRTAYAQMRRAAGKQQEGKNEEEHDE